MTGPWARHSLCQNLLPIDEDEFAGTTLRALNNNSGTASHTSAMSRVLTSARAPAVAPAPTEVAKKYTDKDLWRATQLAQNLFIQGQQ